MNHETKIIQFPVPAPSFNLFDVGNMVHIDRLSRIDDVLRRGLRSPQELARERQRNMDYQLPEQEYVSFWKVVTDAKTQNIIDLIHHIEYEYDDFEEDWPIGYVVKDVEETPLDNVPSSYGVKDRVDQKAIRAIVVPMIPLRILDGMHLDNSENKSTLNKIRKSMAVNRPFINKRIVICDHFGRVI